MSSVMKMRRKSKKRLWILTVISWIKQLADYRYENVTSHSAFNSLRKQDSIKSVTYLGAAQSTFKYWI